jgi:polysaccharide export outer membrane protein
MIDWLFFGPFEHHQEKEAFMRLMRFLRLCMAVVFFSALIACGGGQVVRVTNVQDDGMDGLKEADRAKLEQIKRTKQGQGIDPGLSSVIRGTPHFSASQYLAKHPEARGPAAADYKVGGYDVLKITVYEEKDLSREAVPVSGNGFISFPLIGRIKVDSLTTSEIEKRIARKLAREQYLLDANVSVMVTEYNSRHFLVLGAVKTPGSYSLKARERVLDGISRAEGILSEKAAKKGMIVRTENPGPGREQKIVIDLDLQGLLKGKDQISNIYLMDKDVLFIPKMEHFYVIGQVKNPGSYPLSSDETSVVQAISMAGGFTAIASRNRTRIIRVDHGVEKIIRIKVDAITDAGKKIQDVLIQPGDIIVVPESFF